MPIMTTGMHDPLSGRRKGGIELFQQRQRIDVGPPGNGPSGEITVQNTHHPGAPNPSSHLKLGPVESFRNDFRRTMLLKTQFGVPMKIPAQCYHAVTPLADFLGPGL
jgi:hypothetical protein